MKWPAVILVGAISLGLVTTLVADPLENSLYDQRMDWWLQSNPQSANIVLIGLDQSPQSSVCGRFSGTNRRTPFSDMLQALERLSPKAVALAFQLPDCEALQSLGKPLAALRSHGTPLALISSKPGKENIPEKLLFQYLQREDDPRRYRVEFGDTLSIIAERFNTTVPTLMDLNGLSDPDKIYFGKRLWIRPGMDGELSSIDKTKIGSLQIQAQETQDGVVRAMAWSASSIPPIGVILADLLLREKGSLATPTFLSPLKISENWISHIAFSEPWDREIKPFRYRTLNNFSSLTQSEQETLITNKVVILFNETETIRVRTPRDESVPRAYVHAHILLNFLSGSFIKATPPYGWLSVLILLLISLASISLYRLNWYRESGETHPFTIWLYPLVWGATIAIVYLLFVYLAFLIAQRTLPIIPPIISIGTTVIGVAFLTWHQSFARLEFRMEQLQSERDTMVDEQARLLEKEGESAQELAEFNRKITEQDAAILHLKVELEGQRDRFATFRKQYVPIATTVGRLSSTDTDKLRGEAELMGIITQDPKMLQEFRKLKQFASIKSHSKQLMPIAIFGETGTGKELYARALHRLSDRANGPFESVNMGQLSGDLLESKLFGHEKGSFTGAINRYKGAFQAANGGTIFLDEIANLSGADQQRLLKVLDDGTFQPIGGEELMTTSVRVVVATNKNLGKECKDEKFMWDLYYRLVKGGTIMLPPLRDRTPGDLRLLIQTLVKKSCQMLDRHDVPSLTEETEEWILAQRWKGNVRELEGVLYRSLLSHPGESTIRLDYLKDGVLQDVRGMEDLGVPVESSVQSILPAGHQTLTDKVSDERFIDLLCRHQGSIEPVRALLSVHRDRVSLRIKGLMVGALVQCHGRQRKALQVFLRGYSTTPAGRGRLEKKMQTFYKNLVKTCQDWRTPEEAITAYWNQNRNMPSRNQYLEGLETFIRQNFQNFTRG